VDTNFLVRFFHHCVVRMIDHVLIEHVILDDHVRGHNYLGFLQNGLADQVEVVPLATRIAT
jgi:hypothetical protein